MGSRLPLKTTCQFICMWLVVRHPRHDFMISELGIAPATAIDWSVFCLEICIEALMMRGDSIIGGEGEVVEIDQAKVEKGKYNKGRWVPGSWMFGAFEKEKKGSFFVNVSDCTADILIDIILQRIAPGSIIMSERWQGDERLLSHPKYETVTGKHNIKFVDPGTGARTKNVEKSWRNVHSNLPTHGRKESNMAGYFAEYCWKRKYERQERLHYFLLEMSRQYNKNEE